MTLVVTPVRMAMESGWDELERFEWPGTVVGVVEKPTKTCYQFLIWDNDADCFAMKCWNQKYLQVHDLQEGEWIFMATGCLPNAIAAASSRHGISSTNSGKDARLLNASHGKRTRKRGKRAGT